MDYKPTYMIEDLLGIADGFPMHTLRSREALFVEVDHLLKMLPEVAHDWDDFVTQEDLATALPICRFSKIFSSEIRDDLMFATGKTVVTDFGLLLSLLFPLDDRIDLQALRAKSWLANLLLMQANGSLSQKDQEAVEKLGGLGKIIKTMDGPEPVLWRLEDIPVKAFKAFQAEFKKRYQSSGQAGAVQYLAEMREAGPDDLAAYLKLRFPK